jgi:hypothetical protein
VRINASVALLVRYRGKSASQSSFVGRSCLKEDPLKLGMHLSKHDYGVLESGATLILSAVDSMSTEKRACDDRSGQLPGGQQQSPTYDFKRWLRCEPNQFQSKGQH